MTKKYPRAIACVTANEPPESVRTISQWIAWRRNEDERMELELLAQCEAFFEREFGDHLLH